MSLKATCTTAVSLSTGFTIPQCHGIQSL